MQSLFEPPARGELPPSALPLVPIHPLAREPRAPVPVSPVRTTSAPDHATALHNCLDRPVVGGNLVELLVDEAQTEAAIFAAVRAARDHVHIECRGFDARGAGAELVDVLVARRDAGVSVSVMLDGEATPADDALLARLRRAGVALCRFNPPDTWDHPVRRALHLRDHRKLIIIDGRLALVGGVDEAPAERTRPGRDTHLRIEGPVVAHLQEAFVAHWVRECGRQPSQARHFPGLRRVGGQRAGVAVCEAGSRRSPFARALLAAVERARGRVFITTAHFVPPRPLLEALCAACRRGVDVRLLLPGDGAAWRRLAAARAHYARLLAAGARLFELPGRAVLARTAVVDDEWAAVGSSTLDWSSVSSHATIDVIALDAVLAAQLETAFRDDQASSRAITLEQWSRRGYLPRLQEWTARRLDFLF